MAKLLSLLRACVEICRVVRRRRARIATAHAAESARQFELMDLALRRVVEVVRELQAPMVAIAEGNQKQTELLTQWFKSFQPGAGGDAEKPEQPSVNSDQFDPTMAWLQEVATQHGETIPPEFRLAAALQRAERTDNTFDREGSDF